MAKYQAYPECKDSGIDWLGEIPEHWEVIPTKFLFDIFNGSTPQSSVSEYWDGDIIWVTPADLSKLDSVEICDSQRRITQSGLNSCGVHLVPKGSLILSCRAPIGSLAIAQKQLCTNQGCKSLVPRGGFDSRFFYYYLSVSVEQLNVLGRGTTFLELSSGDLGSFNVVMPSNAELDLIVDFLDYETVKIDQLIKKQLKLIGLLSEKRQAVISHAVIKGLSSNVSMKDSGVHWLNEVPAHWDVCRLKNVLSIKNGRDYKEVEVEEGGYPVYGSGGVFRRSSSYLFDGKSVLFGRKGTVDKPLLVEGKFWTVDTMFYSEIGERVLPKYVYYQATMFPYDLLSTSTALPSMTQEDLLELGFALPSIDEQKEIVGYLDSEITKIDALIQKAESAISLMQERRRALISAAVTGKIDVRNWQAPVTSEVTE